MISQIAGKARSQSLPDTTIVIKTFSRPQCLAKLLRCLRVFGNVPIVVVDDGKPYADTEIALPINVTYIKTGFDIGLSAGRNLGLNHVWTKYFILMDDDFIVPKKHPFTQDLFDAMAAHDLDVLTVGFKQRGGIRYWARDFHIDGRILRLRWPGRHREEWVQPCDLGLNCFLARKEAVADVMWDPELKVREHWDFFLRMKQAGKKVACWMKPHVHVRQQRVRNTWAYRKYRGRNHFAALARRKHGIDKVIDQIDSRAV